MSSATSTRRRVPCKYYRRGRCRFGDRCRNLHQTSGTLRATPYRPRRPLEPLLLAAPPPVRTDLTCGICFDVVMTKRDRRQQFFGILPACAHCFCFACIRRWRQSRDFDVDVAKACPECRTRSDFVYASRTWFESRDAKERFVRRENDRMKRIDCRYFRRGRGKCPFGNGCLYLHALPNGQRLDVGPPKPRRRRTSYTMDVGVASEIMTWLQDDYELHGLSGATFDEYVETLFSEGSASDLSAGCSFVL